MKQLTLLLLLLIVCMNVHAIGGCGPALWISKPAPKNYSIELKTDTIKVVLEPGDSSVVFTIFDSHGNNCDFNDIKWFKNGKAVNTNNMTYSASGIGIYMLNLNVSSVGICTVVVIVTSQKSTAVDELTSNSELNFQLFPNPSTNGIFTIGRETASESCVIQIYNLNGQVIKKQEMHDKNAVIDISASGKGTYFIELSLKDGSKKRKKFLFD